MGLPGAVALALAAALPAGPPAPSPVARPFGTLREQAAMQQEWLRRRLDVFLPALMRTHGIDMWVVPMREYNEDPVFSSITAPETMFARRRTIYAFFDKCAASGTPEGDRLDVLATLIDAYEAKHHAMDAPDPIEAIKFRMKQQGMTRKDLEDIIGTRTRIAEVFNRKRGLSIDMIRRLHDRLGISAEVLIRPSRKEAA